MISNKPNIVPKGELVLMLGDETCFVLTPDGDGHNDIDYQAKLCVQLYTATTDQGKQHALPPRKPWQKRQPEAQDHKQATNHPRQQQGPQKTVVESVSAQGFVKKVVHLGLSYLCLSLWVGRGPMALSKPLLSLRSV